MNEFTVEHRARQSAGDSSDAIHEAVVALLSECGIQGGTFLDVGCGTGRLRARVSGLSNRYVGADAIRHDGFPSQAEFVQVDLDSATVSMGDNSCDLVACIETIEHVENPRALMRELVRLARPGGWLIVTTPNQLTLLSKLSLVARNEFIHFRERPGLYPAHISALLEIDLLRMCRENGLEEAHVRYSGHGRMPLTGREWPRPLRVQSGAIGRAFSDNVLVSARKPL